MHTTKKYYERIIAFCAFLLVFVNVGFVSTSFNVYQSHIVDVPGVGNVGGSLVITIRTLVAMLCMLQTNAYYRALNPRFGIGIATLCTGVAFIVYGFSHSLVGFCVAGALSGIGYGFGGMVAATYLIGNWYRGKVGSISGFATMGSGVASIVVPICAGWLIDVFSLPVAFFVEAAIALLISLFLLKFIRVSPRDIDLETLEEAEEQKPGEDGSETKPRAKLSSVPLSRTLYIAMFIALVLLGGVSNAGYCYFGILLTTQGIDPLLAATLISLAGVFLTISKFAVGVICDKFGTLFGSCLFFVLLIASLVLCSLVGSVGVPEAVVASVMIGIGMPLGTTGVSLWSLELSSQEELLKNIKRFQFAYALGGLVFSMMPGVLCQITGTYTTSYEVLTVMAVICAAMVISVYALHSSRAKKANDRR